jgi:probable phosphoglycerate mutase
MIEIALIRPGSTDYDAQGRIQGTLDLPLSDAGEAEVRRIIGELREHELEAIYASPAQSAWQTASTIAEALGSRLKKLEKLHNLDHGLWQGMLIEEVKRKQPKVFRQWQEQPETVCPPEGETLGQAQERVQTSLCKVVKKHKAGRIGLVVPEPLASIVQSFLSHTDLGDLWKSDKQCGSWELLSVEPQQLAAP